MAHIFRAVVPYLVMSLIAAGGGVLVPADRHLVARFIG